MSKKILIVDDERDVITFLSAILEENGYTSISAKDGVEGLDLLRKEERYYHVPGAEKGLEAEQYPRGCGDRCL
jgi:CheY-like chemotaxis protein